MDIEQITKVVNTFTEENLPSKKILILGIIFLLAIILAIDGLVSKFNALIQIKTKPFFYPILILSWVGYWLFYKFYLPRNKKSKVGIVIAIYSENESERKQLKADFISKLKNNLQQENILEFSEFFFLKNHFSYQIKEASNPLSEIKRMNKKIKAHFYIWGDVKKRSDGDEGEKYFISFQGYVLHKPISKDLSHDISQEFSKVLPTQVNFLENRSFRGFEASARIVHLAIKYIIGLAAFVSNDPHLAIKLHGGLKEQFNTFRPLPPNLQDIRNNIPLLTSDELLWISKWHYYTNNKNDDALKFIKKSIEDNPQNYGAWLFKAILDFSVEKNPSQALKSIDKAKNCAGYNFEWRYSQAFLYFWMGNYPKALKVCHKIKKQQYANEEVTLSEVRKFNLDLLKQPHPQIQLYFWIGYLAYFKEKNYANALLDLEKFEKESNNTMSLLKQRSSSYLVDIKKTMGFD